MESLHAIGEDGRITCDLAFVPGMRLLIEDDVIGLGREGGIGERGGIGSLARRGTGRFGDDGIGRRNGLGFDMGRVKRANALSGAGGEIDGPGIDRIAPLMDVFGRLRGS